jgi:hypothetical protein
MNREYLKEHSKLGIYTLFYSKNKSAYRRQKEKLFINTIKSLAEINTSPHSLTKVTDKDVNNLVEYLKKTDKETTIANKISVLRQGLKYIGVDLSVSVKSIKPKKVYQSKFYRVKEKISDIENTMFRRIAYLQGLTGLSYKDLHNLLFVETTTDEENYLTASLSMHKYITLYFRSVQIKNNFLNTHRVLRDNATKRYSLDTNVKNITSVKQESYRAIRTLYFEELKLSRISEFDVRAVGYKTLWETYFKERFYESEKKEDFKGKLKSFKSLIMVTSNRTIKKYLGIV